MTNLLVGGAAGDGIETMAGLLEKTLHREGYHLFSMRDFMSRIRGGHNFALLRFGTKPVYAHREKLDGLVAFNEESFALHEGRLAKGGFALFDESLAISRPGAYALPLHRLAKEAGNPQTVGIVCMGALLGLLGMGTGAATQVLRENLPPALLEVNLAALRLGHGSSAKGVGSSPKRTKKSAAAKPAPTALLTGADAMAMGALAGGLQFYSAYPMSPATSLLAFFQKQAGTFRVAVEQAEDEIAAANMALGAAYAGARAMAGTSGGGFSLMVEALGFAGMAELPVVFADIMRPGPSTGLPTRTEQSDLDFVIHASHGEFPRMVIALRDHADAFYQTARAFRLAWQYQLPVILLSDQFLADSAATIPPPNAKKAAKAAGKSPGHRSAPGGTADAYLRYALTKSGVSPLRAPGAGTAPVRVDSDEHDESGVITEDAAVRTAQMDKRLRKMTLLRAELQEPAYHGPAGPRLLLVGFGSTAPILAEAVRRLNRDGDRRVGALCFGDVWPLPTKTLLYYAKDARYIVNVEQNATGQLAGLLRREAGVQCDASLLKYDGRQLSVDDILRGVQKMRFKGGR